MGKIVWLASYPRSGNTWLRAFLHNLLRNPKTPYDINRLTDFTLIDADARWYQRFDPRPASQYTKEEVAALRAKVHAAMTRAFPDTVFVKTHNALMEDRGTPLITMEHTAGAIYVVRNPLDVAVSYAAHFGVTLDEAVAAMNRPRNESVGGQDRFVYEVFGSWSENVGSWTANPSPGLHVVRYEDMLAAPENTFGRIAAFLGLSVSPERLARALRHSAFDTLKRQESRSGFKERSLKADCFFRQGRAGQWRQALNARQVELLCQAHHEQMARFGYPDPR
ncbi:MAG: sulfotransferase domain-containing protein [Rhodospirillaceae bacterium]|nr:sulfotransferase domain-containing protein [Rhodospirillaceae bacterium]